MPSGVGGESCAVVWPYGVTRTALVIVARIAHLDGYWEVAPASRSRRSRSRRKSSGDWSVGGVVGRGFLVRTMVVGWLPSTNTSNLSLIHI